MEPRQVSVFFRCLRPLRLAILILSLWSVGCHMVGTEYRRQIQSEDPGRRVEAIIHAGEIRDQHAVPLLVDRLEDEDEGARMFAILSLKKITGKDMGYNYYQPANLRSQAVRRWRAWLLERSAARKDQ